MPNIKSVKKDVERSRQRQLRNQSYKSRMKTMIKKTRLAIASNSAEPTLIQQTESTIDKLAQKGIIHKNAAARRKSRLARQLNKSLQAAAAKA